MKFPRNARIFRGQLDAAPFATVFFLLVIFAILGSRVYVPGVRLDLPSSGNAALPGIDQPSVYVAITSNAIYYKDQPVTEDVLSKKLIAARQEVSGPLTLVVQEDKDVTAEQLIRLRMLARRAGIDNMLMATLPRLYDSGGPAASQP
jgi:biopolymer transport protein ExbD